MAASDDDKRRQLLELMDRFQEAMLVTIAENGDLRGRPMLIAGRDDDGDLWFVTEGYSTKVGEILADRRSLVVMQRGQLYLSVRGWCEVDPSEATLRRLWRRDHETWFPAGPTDPTAVAIHFHAEQAEFWDRTRPQVKRIALELLASARGEPPPPPDGQHGDIELA